MAVIWYNYRMIDIILKLVLLAFAFVLAMFVISIIGGVLTAFPK